MKAFLIASLIFTAAPAFAESDLSKKAKGLTEVGMIASHCNVLAAPLFVLRWTATVRTAWGDDLKSKVQEIADDMDREWDNATDEKRDRLCANVKKFVQ